MDNSFKVRSPNLVAKCLDIKPDYKVKLAGYIQFFDRTMLNDGRLFPALETKTFLVIRLSNLIQLSLVPTCAISITQAT